MAFYSEAPKAITDRTRSHRAVTARAVAAPAQGPGAGNGSAELAPAGGLEGAMLGAVGTGGRAGKGGGSVGYLPFSESISWRSQEAVAQVKALWSIQRRGLLRRARTAGFVARGGSGEGAGAAEGGGLADRRLRYPRARGWH